jgi:hypothetical protein
MSSVGADLLKIFEEIARRYLGGNHSLAGLWCLERKGRRTDLRIASSPPDGFEVGATCETYGLYPWAGEWRGAPWEPVKTSAERLCEEYFGFVRALLSPDARLRLIYRRQHLQAAIVELRTSDGWRQFERMRELVLPFGKRREALLQNHHLSSRFPFAGLQLTEWGIYPWHIGA